MRLDFESFDINGLSNSAEKDDMNEPKPVSECIDKFKITVSTLVAFDDLLYNYPYRSVY